MVLSFLAEQDREEFENLVSSKDPSLREALTVAAGNISKAEGFYILSRIVSTATEGDLWDDFFGEDVAISAARIGGAEGAGVLSQILSQMDGSYNIHSRQHVAYSAGWIGGPEGLGVLNQMKEDREKRVKWAVITAGAWMEGPEGHSPIAGDEL